jgi:hypothetical protein
MKAQRRHELQRNALEVEIRNLWEFLRRRGNYLAWGALGVAAIVLAVVWYVKRSGSDAEATQAKFVRCTYLPISEERTQGLSEVAAKTSHPFWASQATVQLGYDLATILAQRWPDMSDAERLELRGQAESYYKRTISDFPKEPLAAAKAHYGLGKLAESWGDLDQARAEYDGILREAQTADGLKDQPIVFLANDALTKLPLLRGDVYMPASAPATGPATWPATGPASGPATSPASGSASGPSTQSATGPATGPSSVPASSRPVGHSESD